MDINLFETKSFNLSNYKIIKGVGSDCRNFFQGQLTNNFEKLKPNDPQTGVRLDLKGHIRAAFHVSIFDNEYFFLVHKDESQVFVEDLEKFIIMEDVSLELSGEECILTIGPEAVLLQEKRPFFYFCNMPAVLGEFREKGSIEHLEILKCLSAMTVPGIDYTEKTFLNETIHNLNAVDYKKGCFFGQELVAKLEVGRGGAYFPVYFEVEDENIFNIGDELRNETRKLGTVLKKFQYKGKSFLLGTLFRDFRIDQSEIVIQCQNGSTSAIVHYAPMIDFTDSESFSEKLFLEAVNENKRNNLQSAINLLEIAVKVNPVYEDAIETLGVLYENNGERQKAIEIFKNLLEVNPFAIMAHTNLSLIYMRDGKIEEAEKEKANATVKSFQKAGLDSKNKKAEEEFKKQKLAELDRKKAMFEKVLELDSNDTLALYGLGDYFYQTESYDKSIEYLTKVLEQDQKYSTAYLLLGKSYESKKDFPNAIEVFEKGVKVAAAKGDLMPANEMQTRLTKIKNIEF